MATDIDQGSPARPRRKRLTRIAVRAGIFVVVAVAAGVGGFYAVDALSNDNSAAAVQQQLVQVRRGDVSDAVSTNGSLVFPNRERVGFNTVGTLGEILVEAGDAVTEGQELATLDEATVTGLEEAVARAEVALSDAQDKLDDLTAPAGDLELARAAASVVNARSVLANAEDALSDLAAPADDVALARAAAAVVTDRMALAGAEDALAEFMDGAAATAAEADAAAAVVALANASENLRLGELDWSEKTSNAQAALDDSKAAYVDQVARWFGVTLAGPEADISPDALLAGWNTDYETIYARDTSGEFGPLPDDPATPWNELTVSLWTRTFPFGVNATCDSTPAPGELTCVQNEIETSWAAIADADKALAKTESDAANALAALRAAVTRADDARVVAEDAIARATDALVQADLESDVTVARATLSKAESDLADLKTGAEDELVRAGLESDVTVARAALSDAEANLADLETASVDAGAVALSEAQVAVARIALDDARTALGGARLTAPLAGEVSEVIAETGDRLNPGAPVVELLDRSVIEVDAVVDEIDVLRVTDGSQADVTMDALAGQVLNGTVSEIGEAANSQQGVVTFPISVRVDVPDGLTLREGLSATATIVSRQETDALLVPSAAIGGSFSGPTVDRVRDGVTETVPVELGLSDGFWVAVRSGLTDGDGVLMAVVTPGDSSGAAPNIGNLLGGGGLFQGQQGGFGGAGGGGLGGGVDRAQLRQFFQNQRGRQGGGGGQNRAPQN